MWGSPDETPPVPRLTDREELRAYFCCAMTRAAHLFGDYAFRKSLPGYSYWRTPINKALFEVWACQLSLLSEEAFQRLLTHREDLFAALYHGVYKEDDGRFLNAISRDSHDPASVRYRHKAVAACIQTVVEKE